MTQSVRKYMLLIFCVSGSANIAYLIFSNSRVTKIEKGIDLTFSYKPWEKITISKNALLDLVPDTRKLKEAGQNNSEFNSESVSKSTTDSQFMFEINQPLICEPVNKADIFSVDLVVIVISDIKHFLRRVTIRNTWGSDIHGKVPKVRLLFLVGKNSDMRLQLQIKKESELFNDIIQTNVEELYANLTKKSLAMLQWVRDYCSDARFVLKTDDDMYINLPNLINELLKRRESRFFFCYVFQGAPPVRDKNSKWYTSSEEYKHEYFPKYCSGTAYSFSANIALVLFENHKGIKLLKLEDVYITGLLAKYLNIPLIHGEGFWFLKRKSTGCDYQTAISGHEVPVREMYIIHAQLQDTAIDCKTNINQAISGDENDMFQKWQQGDVT